MKSSALKLNLSHWACYFAAVSISAWTLGQSIPKVGISWFLPGVLTLFYVSPFLLLGKKISILHPAFFFGFILIHFLFNNFFSENPYYFNFLSHLLFAFAFFLLWVSCVDSLKVYANSIFMMMISLSLIVLWLDWLHLFVYKSPYLSSNFREYDFMHLGRAGKNTISFFLALTFPFFYAKFMLTMSAG